MSHSNQASCLSSLNTGMALAIMTQVAQMLEALSITGETGSIDLRSLPLTEADRKQLEDLLGQGEVKAELEVAGTSTVRETAYPGAWWIRHLGAGGKLSSEEIAICPVPGILAAHPADIDASAARIKHTLDEIEQIQPEATHG